MIDIAATIALWDGCSDATRYTRVAGLKRILRWMTEDYGAPKVYRSIPRMEKPSPRNVTATEQEKRLMIEKAKPAVRCWLLMCSDLAIRSGTAALMAPKHYDAAAGTLTFTTKKGRKMCLPVTDELAEIIRPLAKLDADTPFVAHLSRNGHCKSRYLTAELGRLRKRCGINRQLTPHDLRRTTAVRVYEDTRDLRVVQAILGHRPEETLEPLDRRR